MGRVYIKRIETLDFTSHKKSELDLSPGNIVFLGENGAGKTSVLNQIMMCLYSQTPVDKKFRDLVRRGARNSKIVLEFQGKDNSSYTIEKEFNRSGSKKHFIYPMDDSNQTIGEGVDGVKKEVERLMGISDTTFKDIVYAQQGEIQKIGDSRSRKELFDRLLGFEKYSLADKNLSGVKKYGDREIKQALKEKEKYEPSVEQLPIEERKLRENQNYFKELRRSRDQLIKKKTNKEKHLEELRPLKKTYEKLNSKIKTQETNVESAKKRANRDKNNLEKAIKKKFLELDLIQTNQLLADWNEMVNELQEVIKKDDNKREFLTRKYGESQPIENEIMTSFIESQTKIKTIYDLKTKIEKNLDYSINERSLEDVKEENQTWKDESVIQAEIVEKDRKRCTFLKTKRAKMEDIENNIKNAEHNLRIVIGYKERTEKQIFDVIPESSNLKKTQRLEYATNYEKQKKYLHRRAIRYSVALSSVIGIIGLIISLFQLVIGVFLIFGAIFVGSMLYLYIVPYSLNNRKNKISQLVEELNGHNKSIVEQKEIIKELKKDLKEFSDYDWTEIDRLEEEIKKINERRKILSTLINLAEQLELNLGQADEAGIKIRENLKKLTKVFQDFPKEISFKIVNMIDKLIKKEIFDFQKDDFLFYEWSEIKKLETRIQKSKEKVNRIENFIRLGNSLKVSLEDLKVNEEQLDELKKSLDLLLKTYTPGSFEETERIIQKFKEKLASINTEIKDYEIDIIPNQIKIVNKIRKEVENYNKAVGKEKHYNMFVELVSILRELYKEIPRILRQEHLDRINKYASDLFRELNPETDITEIRIDKDYNIHVIRFGDFEELNILSGGESVIVCLAIRLAFINALSSCDIAILDEPTAHLDKNRIQELVTVLTNKRPIYQLFIVTHNPNFEQVGDIVYKITKRRGESEVKRVS